MKLFTQILMSAVMTAFFLGCSTSDNVKPLDPQNMDTSVNACDDFFQYANGTWIENNPIPDEYSRYGVFEVLSENNWKDVRSILDEAANGSFESGSNMQKIGDIYSSGLDTTKIEEDGITPLKPYLEKIENIRDLSDVQKVLAEFHTKQIMPMFILWAGSDDKNSEHVIAQLYQGGLGLPDRDYYLNEDGRSVEIREEYLKHLTAMFKLMGDSEESASQAAKAIISIETRMAKASNTRLENRDPHATYNKTTLKKLDKQSRYFDWRGYFAAIGKTEPGDINISQPKFFKEIDNMLADISVSDWKTYLRWQLIDQTASYLSSDFDKQNFSFFGTVLSGRQAQQDRWKRVLNTTSGALGEALGQEYVARFFPPEAKERMLELVENLRLALSDRINNLEWMSPKTKEYAQEKLDVINVKIGYPDEWIDYSKLEIEGDSYVGNVLAANRFDFQRTLDKIDKPVDRKEWHMSPQTVNAYYNPSLNEVVFPAAILQYPFFNMEADDAVNYGAIGMVIGHEMTHGFDDQGRQFDKDGNLNDWWTEQDGKAFEERTQILVDQYNNFSVFDTLHVDGKLTLGENIADLGGMNIAYDALQKSFEKNGRPDLIDGFTPEQRYFLGYAQVWRQSIRDEELMRRLKEDVHSPGDFRVNGPLSNLPQFYAAFDVKEGDGMYRTESDRAVIW
jgi:putative endopeptidase